MQLPKPTHKNQSFVFLFCFLLAAKVFAFASWGDREPTPTPVVEDNPEHTFRAPAKLYGAAYSIKVTVNRDGTGFDAPFWVRPDQAVSTIDLKQFLDLGWYYKDLKMDSLTIGGQNIDIPEFKNAKSDLAFVPDFPKTCCFGVIGQDILKNYRVHFMPRPPSHLEFTRVPPPEESTSLPKKILMELKSLFSVDTDRRTIGGKKVDLSDVSYELNLSKNEFHLDPLELSPAQLKQRRNEPLFTFTFLPPWRKIQILSIAPDIQASAKTVNLKKGMIIWNIQNTSALFIDKFEVERILRGRRDGKIALVVATDTKEPKRRTIYFDFNTNSFSQDK
jgi:hypothetical protein